MKDRTFGQNVYRRRMALGLTQEKFSEKADITRAYLQRIEANTVNPSLDVIRRIKLACGCSWEELLG